MLQIFLDRTYQRFSWPVAFVPRVSRVPTSSPYTAVRDGLIPSRLSPFGTNPDLPANARRLSGASQWRWRESNPHPHRACAPYLVSSFFGTILD